MAADLIATVWPELDRVLDKHLEVTNRLLEQCEYLTKANEGLTAALELLSERVGLHHAQTVIRDNALGERIDGLDDRLTTVHRAALRAANLTIRGGTPA